MKYIIFDLDDTLLNKKHEVDSETLEGLQEYQRKGHYLVINTARSKAYSQKYLDVIKPDYAILNGGAQIIDKNQNNIFLLTVSDEEVNELLKDLRLVSNNITIQTEDTFFTSDKNYKNQNPVFFDFFHEDFHYHALKVLAFIDSDEVGKKIADKYNLAYTSYFGGPCKRMNNKEATKYLGIVNLLRITNGKMEDTICFGDDLGDLEMIKKCHVGVIMQNAKAENKKNIQYVTEYSNEQNGVARFLKKYAKQLQLD